jgi:hypothetical protein
MDLLLTILKFAGIVVGSVSGVLGTVTKTHDETTIPSLIIRSVFESMTSVVD